MFVISAGESIKDSVEDFEVESRFDSNSRRSPPQAIYSGRRSSRTMTADSKFLVVFCYASLALGVVTGLNEIRILVELLFWSSARPARTPSR
jgi:hypothetical protein